MGRLSGLTGAMNEKFRVRSIFVVAFEVVDYSRTSQFWRFEKATCFSLPHVLCIGVGLHNTVSDIRLPLIPVQWSENINCGDVNELGVLS